MREICREAPNVHSSIYLVSYQPDNELRLNYWQKSKVDVARTTKMHLPTLRTAKKLVHRYVIHPCSCSCASDTSLTFSDVSADDRHLRFVGPGLVSAVAYIDPGNWATDLQAGASYGYKLLFVVLLAGLAAIGKLAAVRSSDV